MKKQIFTISSTAIVFLLMAILTFYACEKKDFRKDQTMKTMSSGAMASNDFRFGPEDTSTGYTYTILGRHYGAALNVTNVKNAWNALSPNKIASLTPTHYYIKLTPQNLDDLKAIADANIPVYTFPLDYEIEQYGDYMRDPAQEPNQMPPLYTCLPVDKQFPISSYQILDSIYMLDMRSVIAKQAFDQVGESEIYPGPDSTEDVPRQFLITTNNIQEHINLDVNWQTRVPIIIPPIIDPPVSNPNPDQNVDVPSTVTNACNCSLNSDDRKPSGCIKVEETQFYNGNVVYEGVNDVAADFIGPMFQRITPQTNQYGCFKSDSKMHYKVWIPFVGTKRLPVLFSVIFASGKKTIKGVNHAYNPFEFAFPFTHVIGNVAGGGLNNVNVTYLRDWNINHNETKRYVVATTNNAIYSFDAYANADGLTTLPNNLQVVIHNSEFGGGATPMLAKLQMMGSPLAFSVATFLNATTGSMSLMAVPGVLTAFVGDIYIGYDNYAFANYNFTSDILNETNYHEFAHAIHFKKCANPGLWEQNIKYVINNEVMGSNPPYGSLALSGSGRCALIEMWGYYMGRNYVHRRYGSNRHCLSAPANFQHSWYAFNEITKFEPEDDPALSYIPSGFLQDLCDDNNYNIAHGLSEVPGVPDNCKGYTPAMIFNKMTISTGTAATLIDLLDNSLPAGTTQAAYDALRQSYGY